MKTWPPVLLSALALAACVDSTPLIIADDHPANPRAASGLIEIPLTLSGYKTVDDLAARAMEDSAPPTGEHGGHHHE